MSGTVKVQFGETLGHAGAGGCVGDFDGLASGTDVWWTKRTLEPTHNAQGVDLQGCLPTKQGR